MALLGSQEKEAVPYYLMETGSSVLEENTDFDREVIDLPMRTLDGLIDVDVIQKPCFLKLDVQGYELEVLRGATLLLAEVDVVLMEVSILEYNEGAPLIGEVIQFMDKSGFSLFDITELKRSSGTHALFQADAFFCKHDHAFRTLKQFY